jgi:Ca2+-transporting ATPase
VETLGSVTVICSDKTGTLTENRMTVTVVDVAGHQLDLKERLRSFSPTVGLQDDPEEALVEQPSISLLLLGGALCNDATLEPSESEQGSFSAVGDPTEGALVIAAARAGLWKSKLEEVMPRVSELPFDSERKRMTTVHRVPAAESSPELQDLVSKLPGAFEGEYIAFTKGAVDSLLDVASHVWSDDHSQPLDSAWKTRIMEANNRMAQNGMRVLGVAFRPRPSAEIDEDSEPIERELTIIGMFGMIDPARAEVKDAVRTSQLAGIRPVMITGDHPLTALYIARELGIAPDGQSQILTGQDLDKLSVEQLEEKVETVPVYARVSPEHKLKIVQALQAKGHVVAMTGDGVNDAPALKRADIGVAMGITGTDVSKEASDMVLLDDNFATIVAAVEEGRRIYDNIRKFIRYTMTSNAGEGWVMLLGPFLGMPLALMPLQILWVNLVTDGLPGLALTIEPAERNTMRRKPHPVNENIFGRGMARDILWVGLLMGLVSLLMGFFYWRSGHETWQTMVFTTLTLSQMGNVLSIRSESETLFSLGLNSNRMILWAVLLTFGLQMAVVYVPFLQGIFHTVALPLPDLLVSLALSTVVFFASEAVKAMRNRRNPVAG